MPTRNQPKRWLCANSLLFAFACSHSALAAHSELATRTPLPKAAPTLVKPPTQEVSPHHVVARVAPAPLSPLGVPPSEPKPLLEPKSTRNEILWHGLRIPTIIAFGLSGLSAGGAVATGFAASRGNDPRTCDSTCSENGVRQRALLLTTGVLTGMAAAGLGIGITFMVKAPRNRTESAIRPRFDATISGERAVAKVGWVFSSF